jgi:DNA (cytosine-5)-methyltransferase 1
MSQNKILDLFCGAGGLSLGFEKAGFDVVAGIDCNEKYLKTFNANHSAPGYAVDLAKKSPESFFQDVTDIDTSQITGVIGGPPCKGFSLEGNRDTQDERNTLVDRFLLYVEFIQPQFVVMENVVGIKTMKTPNSDETYFERVLSKLTSLGYEVSDYTMNAADYGVPQKRERVFIIATKDSSSDILDMSPSSNPPKTVEEAFSEISDDAPNREKTNHSDDMERRLDELDYGDSLYDNYSSSWRRLFPDRPAPTIKENHGAPFVHPTEPRVGTVRECAKLQSFPDDFEFKGSKSTQLKTVGNAVPPKLAEKIAIEIKQNCC